MSRRFCITVYRVLASPTCLQLWSGALASRVGISSAQRRRSRFTALGAKHPYSRALGCKTCCLIPIAAGAQTETGEERRMCCCYSLARTWKKRTFCRKRTARVVQHQSPSPRTRPIPDATTTATATTAQSSSERKSKSRWHWIFRLCPRRRVQMRSTTSCKKSHPWRRSSTILDMVPLSFLRNRIL
ncbi:unnamed protein product [Calypogeia fissa]